MKENLISAFQQSWQDPSRRRALALVGSDRSLDYASLAAEVGGLAGRLRAAGMGSGDRVALALPRSVDLAVALLAVLVCGACPCVLEPQLGREELLRRFAMTRMRWLLNGPGQEEDPALAALPSVTVLSTDSLPQGEPYWALDVALEAEAFLLFTSGSSGKPKGVLLSHQGLWLNACGVINQTPLGPEDRLLHVMPLYHTNGVNNQLLAPLLAGSCVILAERFKAEDMPGLMARHQPTLITGVPTMYSRMLACEFPPQALAALRMARCGSAPITEELHRRVEAHLGRPLVVSYGLSEATCTSTMNPPARRKVGAVGTVLAGQEVFLDQGEICIQGASLMLGYLDESSGGQPRPNEGALHTGDLGRFDDEGYLFITGRIKDVIIRGGENLSPSLIEGVLSQVPGVQACCVVGRADADLGEVPVAFVVRSADAAGLALEEQDMAEAVQRALSRIHKPVAYLFLEKLPEIGVGKVDRKALLSLADRMASASADN